MSPDLNPVEHVRDVLRHSIVARSPAPMTIDELKSALVQEWVRLLQELITTLVISSSGSVLKTRQNDPIQLLSSDAPGFNINYIFRLPIFPHPQGFWSGQRNEKQQ
ncbi:hypothetical protein TNCV_560331 [Trichonephila clavipes]|nr:hypothetical protein TNCV_560331 [Trichonephila clavipes]